MYDNSKYYIDKIREDIDRLFELGYTTEEALEILKIAELRVLSSCVRANGFNGQNYMNIAGYIETEER